jgi:hypothetical protein
MPDAAQMIGQEAMELVDHLREEYGPDFKIGAVAVIVDVLVDSPDGVLNPIEYSCSDPPPLGAGCLVA